MEKKNKIKWYDIDVTHDLLQKTDENLTPDEKTAVETYKKRLSTASDSMVKTNEDIRRLCPILCGGFEKNMIPSPGWTEPVKKMCFDLEALNLEYGKYGLYVDVAQSKSKYAELSFYYDIHMKPARFIGLLAFPFKSFVSFCNRHVDFKMTYVQDKAYYTSVEWKEIDRESYMLKLSESGAKLRNHKTVDSGKSKIKTDILTGENAYFNKAGTRLDPYRDTLFMKDPATGKYYRSYQLGHAAEGRYECRRHRILHKVFKLFSKAAVGIECFDPVPSRKRELMHEVFSNKVAERVRQAEKECTSYCEICGGRIDGEGEYGRFTQHGWITYLCRDCAVASDRIYSDDAGQFYQGIKKVKNPYSGKL